MCTLLTRIHARYLYGASQVLGFVQILNSGPDFFEIETDRLGRRDLARRGIAYQLPTNTTMH